LKKKSQLTLFNLKTMNYSTLKKTIALSLVSLMAVGAANAQTTESATTTNAKVFGGSGQYNTWTLGVNVGLPSLILGTGGSAKAVRYVLEKFDIKYKKVSRKPSADSYSYEQLTKNIISKYKLIINTTPLGMFPNIVEAPPIPYEFLTPEHFLFDLIYNPAKTLFLKKGEEHGALIQNGFDMLELQAEENWKIWNTEAESTDS